MSKTNHYVQCRLFRKTGVSEGRTMFSWIPEKYAIRGKFLKLKNRDTKEWDDGWEVAECWSKEKATLVEARERGYLHQRSVSDV